MADIFRKTPRRLMDDPDMWGGFLKQNRTGYTNAPRPSRPNVMDAAFKPTAAPSQVRARNVITAQNAGRRRQQAINADPLRPDPGQRNNRLFRQGVFPGTPKIDYDEIIAGIERNTRALRDLNKTYDSPEYQEAVNYDRQLQDFQSGRSDIDPDSRLWKEMIEQTTWSPEKRRMMEARDNSLSAANAAAYWATTDREDLHKGALARAGNYGAEAERLENDWQDALEHQRNIDVANIQNLGEMQRAQLAAQGDMSELQFGANLQQQRDMANFQRDLIMEKMKNGFQTARNKQEFIDNAKLELGQMLASPDGQMLLSTPPIADMDQSEWDAIPYEGKLGAYMNVILNNVIGSQGQQGASGEDEVRKFITAE